MRGEDPDPGSVFRYVPLVKRIPSDHPLRPMREMVDVFLRSLAPQLDYNLLFRWFVDRVGWTFVLTAAACNLVWMRTLLSASR